MLIQDLEKELMKLAQDAREAGYTVKTPELFVDPVHGKALAFYQHNTNKIVIHDHFVDNGTDKELENTLIHELSHAVAEQNNTLKKRVWHGDAWKDVMLALGGNAERYHAGEYKKPEFKKRPMYELYAIQPKYEASRWEHGTYNQWLTRGYHVIKGQKATLKTWTFKGDEFEKLEDGEVHTGVSRKTVLVFEHTQVERNEPKKVEA